MGSRKKVPFQLPEPSTLKHGSPPSCLLQGVLRVQVFLGEVGLDETTPKLVPYRQVPYPFSNFGFGGSHVSDFAQHAF